MDTVQQVGEPMSQVQSWQDRRGCLFRLARGLKWYAIALVVLAVMGAVYQTVATETDKRSYTPRGQLYTVGGHQMHIICQGENVDGSPTVILQAGGAAESNWWYWVQQQMAAHTRVCAYDRPGHGWSEPTSDPRNPAALADELRMLLGVAGVEPPYVMAGHSFGAVWTRVYAARYPNEIAGIVLVDGTPLDKFASQSEYGLWKLLNDAVHVPLWAMYRTGVWRLIGSGTFQELGLPPEVAREAEALQFPNHVFDADYAEQSGGMWNLLQDAAAAEDLGDLPMIVLWASLSDTAREALAPVRAEIAAFSTNSVTRYIEGADHGTILAHEAHARKVSDAILDVIATAKTGEPLAT